MLSSAQLIPRPSFLLLGAALLKHNFPAFPLEIERCKRLSQHSPVVRLRSRAGYLSDLSLLISGFRSCRFRFSGRNVPRSRVLFIKTKGSRFLPNKDVLVNIIKLKQKVNFQTYLRH